MEGCPLYHEQLRLFSKRITCEATGEDLTDENELLELYCRADYQKCLRFQTYHDLRIEYLVRRKLKAEFGA